MTTPQKLLLLLIVSVSYIVGAHIWFKNGWDQNDFKALIQNISVLVTALFGPNILTTFRNRE
jgi:hypothetical protein